ncbi:MAG: DUF2079 domain-containing protein [Chloroflexota bacterium]
MTQSFTKSFSGWQSRWFSYRGFGRILYTIFSDPYQLVLFAFIFIYCRIFTQLAIGQHLGMRTHKADLGQIDQAIWNSSRGRWLEMTDNGFIATRLTDHVEPILALISPIYWIWDDVQAILTLQVVVVGVAAWFVYDIAQDRFSQLLTAREQEQIWEVEPLRRLTRPMALALAAAYLLAPQLQSAILTEFHAIPLAVPLILWAFWATEMQRWRQVILAILLVASVKEEAALLAAGLGVWALWRLEIRFWRPRRLSGYSVLGALSDMIHHPKPSLSLFLITLVCAGWFWTTTFVIVPLNAETVYGEAESSYFQRYGALGDSPMDIFKSFFVQPELVLQIATEPARFAYLRNLLWTFGFLSLLAPEILLLALPVLLANLLSAYPAQYYGEFHYSAPLIAYVAVSSAFGMARLWGWIARRFNQTASSFQYMPTASGVAMNLVAFWRNSRNTMRPISAGLLILWVMIWSLSLYQQDGRGPRAGRHDPTPYSEHHQQLYRFVDQIPTDAAVTATAAVHPHVSHRRHVYQFPIGISTSRIPEDMLDLFRPADWALLDVTTATDMAPGDVKVLVEQMLAGDWGVVDAADGFLLMRKGSAQKGVPNAFFDFARATNQDWRSMSIVPPQPMDDNGNILLQFVGVRVEDWARWRQTQIVSFWRPGVQLPDATAPQYPFLEVRSPSSEPIWRLYDILPPALLWYPPDRWQPGEIIRITSLPLYLPKKWGVAASTGTQWQLASVYQRAEQRITQQSPRDELVQLSHHAFVGEIDGRTMTAIPHTQTQQITAMFRPPPPEEITTYPSGGESNNEQPSETQPDETQPDSQPISVHAWLETGTASNLNHFLPGMPVDVWLQWHGTQNWPRHMDVFVHLRQQSDNYAQNDGVPRFFVAYNADQVLARQGYTDDWRQLVIPIENDVTAMGEEPMTLDVFVGLYDRTTGQRADVLDGSGQPVGNELLLGTIVVDPVHVADQTCALIPVTCASQTVKY